MIGLEAMASRERWKLSVKSVAAGFGTKPASVCPGDAGRKVVPGFGRLRGLRLLRVALDDRNALCR